MARNGTGVFAVLNPILIGGLRSSDDVNNNFTDMGDAITGTLPLDAQAGMTGPFKLAQGSTTFPAMGFGADRNIGFRRRGADSMAWVAGGIDRSWNDAEGMVYAFSADIAGDIILNGDFDGSGDLPAIEHLADEGETIGLARRTGTSAWALDNGTTSIRIGRDSHGVQIPTGVLADIEVPFAGTLLAVSLLANASGSCVVDIWKDTYANFPPTVADTICGSNKPTITSTTKYSDVTLAGWTTAITAGDILRFNINSISAAITKLTISLALKRYI